ncbi:hydroxymyristoyl-ACP dehydratase [Rhodanobacter thiooxydans]|uniref:Hydroxymyristoyl-ACP dehydratase n=1 Tax=Rhodanobacter thiooxydans TaxID=416169 RepID=A0A154QGS1_9GAMM|nr:hydroxymyristoyl-ACP dehydratase [Rhodanobacter thiooxydans]EIL98283.1 (3R)-hydroxymyristoyl-ACP dehydratase [Rhodanobacter thiooxydans LCS2]KZC23031.1 hydroxymyristoyl-ACP dehydratase [Rhodanobacter thiooxydans]
MNDGFVQALRVGVEHPALPGHFPGAPLVPGVLLLEQVALALRAWRGQRLGCVLEAKFAAPLQPDETAQLQLTMADASRVRFEIRRDGMVLARGLVEGAA